MDVLAAWKKIPGNLTSMGWFSAKTYRINSVKPNPSPTMKPSENSDRVVSPWR